eukprot:TRINITY_DN4851_c0_g1_i1.p1 TRINITY_DN4851_c0_g1~~TRINITY_DN4851_c0_g1_i1.p1  ORF type:complete len:133 (+),score=30.78 TRINITY_DN4851_c0_g1_i1:46-399(+)
MGPHLEQHGADFVKKLNAIYQFQIFVKKGQKPRVWTVDLKNGSGSIADGETAKPDATFILSEANCIKLAQGTLNPQIAFLQGKMKIRGNMKAATLFTPELFPKPTPENMEAYRGAKL